MQPKEGKLWNVCLHLMIVWIGELPGYSYLWFLQEQEKITVLSNGALHGMFPILWRKIKKKIKIKHILHFKFAEQWIYSGPIIDYIYTETVRLICGGKEAIEHVCGIALM